MKVQAANVYIEETKGIQGPTMVNVELIRIANRAAIEGKKYDPKIEAAAARLPRLSADEINRAWGRFNGRRTETLSL